MTVRVVFWVIWASLLVNPFSAVYGQERGIAIEAAKTDRNRRVALIIGNSNYAVSPLKNPRNDAVDIGDVLAQLNFEVTTLIDSDLPSMNRAITAFGNNLAQSADVALFYFAGHGMQVDGRNFLIPVSADIQGEDEVAYKAIDASLVLAKMESAGSMTNILILDACRNNPFARKFRSGTQGLAQMDAPRGTLIVYATAPGDVAFDGDARNGIFTESLLRNIGTPDMDVELMFRQVRVQVLEQTQGKQTPWTSSSLQGNFSFNGRATSLASLGQGTPAAVISPRRSWRQLLPDGTSIEDYDDGGSLMFEITSTGRSEHADSASRRIMGQRDAMRNMTTALKARLEFHDIKLSAAELRRLESLGETTDLVYRDDGKTVVITYELSLPTELAARVRASAQ